MNIGELMASLGCDTKGLDAAEQRMKGFVGNIGTNTASISALGSKLTMGLTVPLLAAGAALMKVASDMKQASNIIRINTGATGEELHNLIESFHAVAQSVPNEGTQVAQAIAGINTRLGLTGKPLEELAFQMSNLARITNTEMGFLVQQTTRLFGDWSIATDKQAASLDYMFRVTQKTGIQFGRLTELTVQFGAPMRSLGFSLEQGAALLGKWEKEGVNMETLLSGLRFGLGHFAAAGKDPVEALKKIISSVRNAGSAAEATTIAFKTFGRRAAVDMYRAIVEGRFTIDDLVTALKGGSDTINKAGADTLTFGNKITILKNQIEDALIPAAETMMKTFGPPLLAAIKGIGTVMKFVGEGFGKLPAPLQKTLIVLAGLLASLGPAILVFGKLVGAVGGLATAFGLLPAGVSAFIPALLTCTPLLVAFMAAAAGYIVFDQYRSHLHAAIEETGRWQAESTDAGKRVEEVTERVNKLAEELKKQGIFIPQGTKSLAQWAEALQSAQANIKNLSAAMGDVDPKYLRFSSEAVTSAADLAAAAAEAARLEEERAFNIARANAIAGGAVGDLIDMTARLTMKQMEYDKILKKAEEDSSELDIGRLTSLAWEITGMNKKIDLMKEMDKYTKEAIINQKQYAIGSGLWDLARNPIRATAATNALQELEAKYKEMETVVLGKWESMGEAEREIILRNQALRDDIISKVLGQMEELKEADKEKYLAMIESVRSGAGEVFDAMVAKGKNAFTSLLDWIQAFFLSRLRQLFMNFTAAMFTKGGGGFNFEKLFEGVFPNIGGLMGKKAGGGFASMGGVPGINYPAIGLGMGLLTGPQQAISADLGKAINTFNDAMKAGGAISPMSAITAARIQTATSAGMMAGGMLMANAWETGSIGKGVAGGVMAGASAGAMAGMKFGGAGGGPLGAGIGAGIGALAGYFIGKYGGGEKKRIEEAAHRATVQGYGMRSIPAEINIGGALEQDITGRFQDWASKGSTGIVVNANINLVDGRHAREAAQILGNELSRVIQSGGTILNDTLGYESSMP